MSVISTQHEIVKYTGKEKALSGQALLTYTFRVIKENSELANAGFPVGSKPDNICVSVPVIGNDVILANVEKFLPALQDVILQARKDILKDAFMARKTSLSDAELDISAVIAKLAETTSSDGRFSKAMLKTWFEDSIVDIFAPSLMTNLGITPETPETAPAYVKMVNTLNAVLDLLSSFVFSKKTVDSTMLANVEKILSKITSSLPADVVASDDILQLLLAKVRTTKERPAEDLLSLL